ncbi:MAG TPA: bifunctional riboflavin kinase/FAD synthetase, partial [Acidobacteriota bacterium]
HRGHQAILTKLVEDSRNLNLPNVVMTFDPVPKKVLSPETAPPLIQTLEQRLEAFERLGVDSTIVVVFDLDFARKSPQDFVKEYLIDLLQVHTFVVSGNFAFGYKKQGNITLLKQMGTQYGFNVDCMDAIQDGGSRISSTLIRGEIQDGQIEKALIHLGHPFALRGSIVKGEQLGGKIGIPTANLQVKNELLPARGVYACRAIFEKHSFPSAVNVGYRPTVGGKNLTVEAHLIGFSGELYGKEMELQFFHRIREEKQFAGIDALRNQILADINAARLYLESM